MLIVKGGEKIPSPEVIPTPSYGMNYILGGGWWTGRVHILWGNPSAGKTTFALYVAAEAQKMGYHLIYIDSEKSATDEWLVKCGIDINERTYIQSNKLEDINKHVLPMLREKGSKYIVIVDSINTIVNESFYNKDDNATQIGMYARAQSQMFQKLADVVTVDHMVICIAQQTSVSSGMFFKQAGKFGQVAEHWATNIVRLSTNNSTDDNTKDTDGRITARKVTWKFEKSKQKPIVGTLGDYWFSPMNADIDRSREIFHLAVRNKVIKKGGAWYSYGDIKGQGADNFLEAASDEDVNKIYMELMATDLSFDIDDEVTDDD